MPFFFLTISGLSVLPAFITNYSTYRYVIEAVHPVLGALGIYDKEFVGELERNPRLNEAFLEVLLQYTGLVEGLKKKLYPAKTFCFSNYSIRICKTHFNKQPKIIIVVKSV